jgi:hypothetical protein
VSILDLIDKYGIFAGLGILIVIALIPLIRDRIIPALIAEREERERFRRQIELDRLASAKQTDENISKLAVAMSTMTERMTTILQNQNAIQERENDILNVLNAGISAMRERVSEREGYERGRREHKKGDTGQLGEAGNKP